MWNTRNTKILTSLWMIKQLGSCLNVIKKKDSSPSSDTDYSAHVQS